MASAAPKITKEILELTRKRMKKSRIPALLGFHVESLASGSAVLTMEVKERHKQIHDVLQPRLRLTPLCHKERRLRRSS